MNSILDSIKSAGAWIIIVLLAGMMAITFTGETDLNIEQALSGRNSVGEFDGETIDAQDFLVFQNNCEQQARRYREQFRDLLGPGQSIDSFFRVDDCVQRSLQQAYVVPSIGRRLGLGVSAESVREAAESEARQMYQTQDAVLEEDRLSLNDMYKRVLQGFPLELRRRQRLTDLTGNVISAPMPVPDAAVAARTAADRTSMSLRLVRYNTPQLVARFKKTVSISEERLREVYEEEQAELEEDKRRPFEDERIFVMDRVKTEAAREAVKAAKEELKQLGRKATLEDVSRILQTPIENAGRVTLKELQGVRAGNTSVSLLKPEFLMELAEKRTGFTGGPYEDGEYTIHVEVQNLSTGTAPEAALAEVKTNVAQGLAREFFSYLLKEETLRGQFSLQQGLFGPPPGTQIPPGAPGQ